MTLATIHEAKTHLSRLIQRALAGEEAIIANAGTPVVRKNFEEFGQSDLKNLDSQI